MKNLKNTEHINILKVIVGSHAHGLAGETSDVDYRGVFCIKTSEILRIGSHIDETRWIEGHEDDTSWEIGKFLLMATKCNPTVLECFLAPMIKQAPDNPIISASTNDGNLVQYDFLGRELQALFPYVWNSQYVKDAFIGYGINQRKKFFENKDQRAPKYAAAYLRVLYNAWELLETGTFTVKIADTPVGETVRKFKNGDYSPGEVIQACWDMETKVLKAYKTNPDKKTEIEPVNEFLLKIRKEFWE